MRKVLLASVAALSVLSALAAATAQTSYRPQYDTRPWEAAEPPPNSEHLLPSRRLAAPSSFDWGKYCGSKNEYCDPSDSEDNEWQPPSESELRNCTKNGKLDYACLRETADAECDNLETRHGCRPKPRARVTVAPPYQGPPPIGWVFGPYTQCANPPQCSMGVVNVQADGLNVRITPNGPPVMSLVNGTPLIPLQEQGDWLLVAPACDLTPTWAWSWNAGVPLNRCWVYF
jgi:hypothetical protein